MLYDQVQMVWQSDTRRDYIRVTGVLRKLDDR